VPMVQQNSTPHLQESSPDQPAPSPEELLLAVSRIKQERADTPPAEENRRGARRGEEARWGEVYTCTIQHCREL